MKKIWIIYLVTILVCGTLSGQAQTEQKYDEQTLRDVQLYQRMAELKRMVKLTSAQEEIYVSCCVDYYKTMYQAIYVEEDLAKTVQMIYEAKKSLADTLMGILTERQRATYIRNTAAEEIKYKTLEKMAPLQESGEYSTAELQQFYRERYKYLMLEKIVYIQHKYDFVTQKESIAQLKAMEPQALKTAHARQKMKRKGISHQNGYQW
ncbi:MAG: hypothetical protein LBD52_05585 [Prevotellaceae bacterium]|jgi:hypothetical protein|nr:hypothetical protein [Prevotellaceae bacterium]